MSFLHVFLILGFLFIEAHAFSQPRALHLSIVDERSAKCVWYVDSPLSDLVEYDGSCVWGDSSTQMNRSAIGRSYSYTAGGFNGSLHEVELTGLAEDSSVYYRCGSNHDSHDLWSYVKRFVLSGSSVHVETPIEISPWIGLVADMGVEESSYTISSMASAAQAQSLGLVIHGGDISYADDYLPSENNSYIWIEFMKETENFASTVPYMSCPGNHEAQFDFAAYTNWMRMPHTNSKSPSPFYYSFNYAGVHYLMMSTEHDFTPGSIQYQWIEKDLEEAFYRRRLGIPWIVVVGHRPLYCSSVTLSRRCTEEAPKYRQWLEPLLHKWKVDVYLCGHNHQYERSYPVYNMTVSAKSYLHPNSTVFIVNGAAGNKEHNDPDYLPDKDAPWRAAHGKGFDTGWMRMRASAKQMQFEYHLSETGRVTDTFTITRRGVIYGFG